MSDTIQVCPDCDSSDVHSRVQTYDENDGRDGPATEWYCNACREGFDDPVERERKSEATPGYSGPAADLIAADPEEIP